MKVPKRTDYAPPRSAHATGGNEEGGSAHVAAGLEVPPTRACTPPSRPPQVPNLPRGADVRPSCLGSRSPDGSQGLLLSSLSSAYLLQRLASVHPFQAANRQDVYDLRILLLITTEE